MRLLVDTDIFVKLAVGGVLEDAVSALGAELSECRRLAALPFMLRRGRLRNRLGDEVCDSLMEQALAIPVLETPEPEWLDKLAQIHEIDPGEAQLFAVAAQDSVIIASGDKRALRALKNIVSIAELLSGRIVVLEALLIVLCDRLGLDEVRLRVGSLKELDTTVKICFSTTNRDPIGALWSYYQNLAEELSPLLLWNPRPEKTT